MGSDGSQGPRPYKQFRVSTTFLRVPSEDWVPVTRGAKSEFRASPRAVSRLWSVEPPTPVVAYRVRGGAAGGYDSKLMVLEDKWLEPLGAISQESLEAEGFQTLAEFRRYWMQRERRRFMPTRMVTVYKVRLWQPEDEREFAEMIFRRLYGKQLEQVTK